MSIESEIVAATADYFRKRRDKNSKAVSLPFMDKEEWFELMRKETGAFEKMENLTLAYIDAEPQPEKPAESCASKGRIVYGAKTDLEPEERILP